MTNTLFEWISDEKFYEVVDTCFKSSIKKFADDETPNKLDPTLVVAMSSLMDLSIPEVTDKMKMYGKIKTLQNGIGRFHESILGSANGWMRFEKKGGVFDIYSLDPVELAGNRKVVAEIKMRYNTIKGVDECKTFDKLKDASASRGGVDECVAYLVQIVPKNNECYNRPWKVSNRVPIENVRCIDGRSAYHLVTGSPTAFDDVMRALPSALQRSLEKASEDPSIDWTRSLSNTIIETAVNLSLPKESAFSDE